MASRRYTVLIEKGPRSYGATVPDLPGCVAVARSRREVLRLIGEAIPQHLAAIAAAGEMAPPMVHEAAIVEVEVPFERFRASPDTRSAAFARQAHRDSVTVRNSPRADADQAFVDAISAWDSE